MLASVKKLSFIYLLQIVFHTLNDNGRTVYVKTKVLWVFLETVTSSEADVCPQRDGIKTI